MQRQSWNGPGCRASQGILSLRTKFPADRAGPRQIRARIAYLPLADGADVVKFDPGLNRIYVACYSGSISVFEQKDPEHYRKLGDVNVAHAVHSIAVDTETRRVYARESRRRTEFLWLGS